jgi:hypothetical protein
VAIFKALLGYRISKQEAVNKPGEISAIARSFRGVAQVAQTHHPLR